MNNKNVGLILGVILVILIMGNPFYVLSEGEQAVVTMFGKPRGNSVVTAGLKLKIPFFEKVTKFQKRLLEWDGFPSEIPTKDKRYIFVDTTARWRIKDALKFFKSVSDERGGQAILDGIIDAAVRDAVTAQNLVEVVRSSNRIVEFREQLEKKEGFIEEAALEAIRIGRDKIRQEIVEKTKNDLDTRFGIELIDVRIKRINYVEEVQKKVYERMIAERRQAAEEYRSEGRGIRAGIEGRTEKELKGILSQAYKESQKIKGLADAKSTKIYADAYNEDPQFYSFFKTLETYQKTIDANTTVILTTDGEYFKYLKEISPQ
ncbi:MAG: protease modulator HflC [Candidatus Omnitrophica bacterium]|nr:protease modulator HflC [Candidatus Omnitrophota bacterium]